MAVGAFVIGKPRPGGRAGRVDRLTAGRLDPVNPDVITSLVIRIGARAEAGVKASFCHCEER
jgi:hypothetical protein